MDEFSLRDHVSSSDIWEELWVEPLLHCNSRRQNRWVVHIWKTSTRSGGVFIVWQAGWRPRGWPRLFSPLRTFPSDDLSFPEKKILTLDLDQDNIQVRVWKGPFWAPLWSLRDPVQVIRVITKIRIYSYSILFLSLYKCLIVTSNRLVDKVSN